MNVSTLILNNFLGDLLGSEWWHGQTSAVHRCLGLYAYVNYQHEGKFGSQLVRYRKGILNSWV